MELGPAGPRQTWCVQTPSLDIIEAVAFEAIDRLYPFFFFWCPDTAFPMLGQNADSPQGEVQPREFFNMFLTGCVKFWVWFGQNMLTLQGQWLGGQAGRDPEVPE